MAVMRSASIRRRGTNEEPSRQGSRNCGSGCPVHDVRLMRPVACRSAGCPGRPMRLFHAALGPGGRGDGSSVLREAVRALTIGSVACRVLPAGIMAYEPESLYAGLSPEDTGPAVSPLLDDRGLVPVPYHPLLVQTAAGPALIDTGAGLALAEESGEPVGRLPQALGAAGVAAEDVALVPLSHAHPDHIGGPAPQKGTPPPLGIPRSPPRDFRAASW